MDDLRGVVRTLTTLPVAVFNSHTHPDHVGDNWQFDRIYALNTPYTRANAHGRPHSTVAAEVVPAHVCGRWPAGFDTATYVSRPFRITDTVSDGSIIDLGGRQLRVLAIPGHAPDASALFDSAHGLLFTGDTFYEAPIYVLAPGADFSAFRRSVDRLAGLAPRVHKVLAAHNVAVSDPALVLRLRDGVHAIADGSARGTLDGGIMTYDFGAFSVMVRQYGSHGAASRPPRQKTSAPKG